MSTLTAGKENNSGGIGNLRLLPVFSSGLPGGPRVLELYRYISWLLTSLFYLLGPPDSPVYFKLGVIAALLVAGRVSVYLYEHNSEASTALLGLVSVETVGIALLLIPTGGLDSPFMWYALNPIFMAAVLLPGVYCWLVLCVFLAAASTGTVLLHEAASILTVWGEDSWLVLVFLLLTTAAQLFARLARQLSRAYDSLALAHRVTEHSLAHISSLYQALEAFSSGENPRRLAGLLADYSMKLSGSRVGLCYLELDDGSEYWETVDPEGLLPRGVEKEATSAVGHYLKEGVKSKHYLPVVGADTGKYKLVCLPVQSPGAHYGWLGFGVSDDETENDARAVHFLAELGAVVLERCKTDELAARLLVSEEQNRIAGEIHDGASQYLFSIVYALHALGRRKGSLQDEQVQRQLSLVQETANRAARELRASIYRISPRRRGEQVFIAGMSSYLQRLARLSGVEVDFKHEGDEEDLSPALRKAFYRIVCEATSNAVRHGKCDSIKVSLRMVPGDMCLEISDDGQGFNVIAPACKGLGLANMRSLMSDFNGDFDVQSGSGKGTSVICKVPAGVTADHAHTGGGNIEGCCG
ncbi:Histidine kinase-, DNA gyrase B-, and HSP90-like ATPase [Desulfotomaculum arcticum]|uniref:histidine kinase n=1 Tax=Desulfotruncus arcticus DSM 17038 TaxID=1121424 RepID=A0A1I2UZQ8_9FIRM|nr:ATP-binding protein [Desulfotruncus arcticus]SFG82420.1 Histidine kinase-, DNA gyrase B-, and HSP90-like ATPase [Desulfotomaculum arcticum] [Desulfotruncus arcticus DSM 17038]